MARYALGSLGLLALLAGLATADKGEAARKPLGTWAKTSDNVTITFEIKPDLMRCTVTQGDNTVEVDADYGVSKDGVLFGRVSKVKKSSDGSGASEGDLFSFHYKVDKDKLMLTDLKMSMENSEVKEAVEGEYKAKAP